MARKSKATLEHEAAVKRAFPKVIKIPVISPNPLNNIYLLDLDRVSYIITRNALEDNKALIAKEKSKKKKTTKKTKKAKPPKEASGEIVFVCRDGSEYSNYSSLKELEDKFEANEGNVWFMRTSNSHIINLREVQETRVNHARDVFFRDIEDRVINAITRTYFEKFQACPHFL